MENVVLTREFALANLFGEKGRLSSRKMKRFNYTQKEVYDVIYGAAKCEGDNCNEDAKFENFRFGYRMFCCQKCRNTSTVSALKREATNLARFGVKNASQASDFREKIEATNLKRYGVKHISQLTIVRENMEKIALTKEFALANLFGKGGKLSSRKMKQFNYTQKEVYDVIHGAVKCIGDYCTKDARFQKFSTGYTLFCCQKCQYSSTITVLKRESTNLVKYGAKNIFQSSTVKKTIEETNLAKYGVKHVSQIPGIREKIEATNLAKYGVKYISQIPESKEKAVATNLARRGYKYPSQSPEVRKKIESTNLAKLGVKNCFQSPRVRKKWTATIQKKYGVEHISQVPEIRDRAVATTLIRFGVKYASQSPDVREKIEATNLDRYGVKHISQIPEVREKVESTNLTKLGFKNPLLSPEIRAKIEVTNLEKYGYKSYLSSALARQRNEAAGLWTPLSEKTDFARYKTVVYSLTIKASKHTLVGIETRGREFHLDHMFSIKRGFEEKIPPFIVGDICNFEILPYNLNISKGVKCSITKEELFNRFYSSYDSQ